MNRLLKYTLILCLSLPMTVIGQIQFVESYQNNTNGISGLTDAFRVTVSPDGKNVYAVSISNDALVVFSVDPCNGKLTFVEKLQDGVGGIDGLNGAMGLSVSPDGNFVYTVSNTDDALNVFSRDSATGALTLAFTYKDNQGGFDGLNGARAVNISPDGQHLYVVSTGDHSLASFERNTTTGAVTFLQVFKDGINGIDGLFQCTSVEVSADGQNVYTTGEFDNALLVFTRNATTGILTLQQSLFDQQNGITSLDSAVHVASSPDGNHVYVASFFKSKLAVFARANDGTLTFVEEYQDNTNGINGLGGAFTVVVSPDNLHVYVVGRLDHELSVFSRDPSTGKLTLIQSFTDGVNGVSGLDGVNSVAVNPTGNYIYTAARLGNELGFFSWGNPNSALPVVDLGDDLALCEGQTAVLNAGSGFDTYTWGSDNGTIGVASSLTVSQAGEYWVTVSNSCGIDSDTIIVNYDTNPLIELGLDTVLCEGQALVLDAGSGFISYEWSKDNMVIGSDQTIFITEPGTYSLTVENGCGVATDAVRVDFEEIVNHIILYPNPTNHILNIELPKVNYDLHLYDITGRLIQIVPNTPKWIDVSRLPVAVYVIRLFTEDGRILTARFVRE